jgi:hypothetical protein
VCVYFGLVVLPPVFSLILTFFERNLASPAAHKRRKEIISRPPKKTKIPRGKKRHDDQYKPRPFFLFYNPSESHKTDFFFFPFSPYGSSADIQQRPQKKKTTTRYCLSAHDHHMTCSSRHGRKLAPKSPEREWRNFCPPVFPNTHTTSS